MNEKLQAQLNRDFFNQLGKTEFSIGNSAEAMRTNVDYRITNDKYLIQFICGSGVIEDPAVMDTVNSTKQIMLSYAKIVTAYMVRSVYQNSQLNLANVNEWLTPMSMLPWLSSSKPESRQFSLQQPGNKIPAALINTLLDINPAEGQALTNFKLYLEQQGEFLKKGIEKSTNYSTLTVVATVDVTNNNGARQVVPRLKLFAAAFNAENAKWNNSCSSTENISVEFEYSSVFYEFDMIQFNNPDKRKQLDQFINSVPQYPIDACETYFNGDFTVKDN